jgi:hypothetical protein
VLALLGPGLGVVFQAQLVRLPLFRSGGRWLRGLSLGLGLATALALFVAALPAVPDRWVRAEPRGDLHQADAFVVFALGLGQPVNGKPTPGESNRAIARWLVEHNAQHSPAIVQEGVYLALKELEADRPDLRLEKWVIRLPHRPGVYVDTSGAALQAWAILDVKGRHRPALLAHDLHLQRMAWTFDQLGMEDAIVPDLPAMPFDPDSSQHWGTRSRRGWLAWELLLARPVALRPLASLMLVLLVAGLAWALLRMTASRAATGQRTTPAQA